MNKEKLTVSMDGDAARKLDASADRFGMSKNQILAAAGYELSRVPAEDLWQAIARIAEGRTPSPQLRLAEARQALVAPARTIAGG